MKQNYLGNKKVSYNGIKFDSKLELRRYKQLLLLEKSGSISFLELQPKFVLQDKFYVIKNGKKQCIKKLTYSADFRYMENGRLVIEDTKGHETDKYKIKRKLFLNLCEYDIFREYKSSKNIIDYFSQNSSPS